MAESRESADRKKEKEQRAILGNRRRAKRRWFRKYKSPSTADTAYKHTQTQTQQTRTQTQTHVCMAHIHSTHTHLFAIKASLRLGGALTLIGGVGGLTAQRERELGDLRGAVGKGDVGFVERARLRGQRDRERENRAICEYLMSIDAWMACKQIKQTCSSHTHHTHPFKGRLTSNCVSET
jgi:hypothetical protein